MQTEYMGAMLTGVWILFIGALGYAAGIVGGIAVTILAIVGVAACGTKLLRAFGFVLAERRLPFQGADTIDGVVVNRSSAGMLDR